jgi:hypothetical protein
MPVGAGNLVAVVVDGIEIGKWCAWRQHPGEVRYLRLGLDRRTNDRRGMCWWASRDARFRDRS